MVIRNYKRRQIGLGMAWVDYKKAYDIIPHSSILKCMELFEAAGNIIALLDKSMNNWERVNCKWKNVGDCKHKDRYLSRRQPVSIAVHCGPNSTIYGVVASESWL